MARKRKTESDQYHAAFPRRLREIMSERGITQQTIADAIGKTRQSVSCYADGSSSPDWSTLVQLSRYLGVSTDWLLGQSDYMADEMRHLAASELGLSEKAIKILKTLSGNEEQYGKMILTLNTLIEQNTDEAHDTILRYLTAYLFYSKAPEIQYRVSDLGLIPQKLETEYNNEDAVKYGIIDFFTNSIVTITDSELFEEALFNKFCAAARELHDTLRHSSGNESEVDSSGID